MFWLRERLSVPVICALAAVAIEAGGDAARALLRYQRDALTAGEPWRLATGHFTHLGWRHLILNLAGLALVWVMVGRAHTVLRWWLVLAVCVAAIDLGLRLDTGLAWYVGLSGVLHGLFAAGLVARIRAGATGDWLIAMLLAAKLVWEQIAGGLPLTAAAAGGDVVVDAHLFGALGGLGAALLLEADVAFRR